jgi:hypothetical protein
MASSDVWGILFEQGALFSSLTALHRRNNWTRDAGFSVARTSAKNACPLARANYLSVAQIYLRVDPPLGNTP